MELLAPSGPVYQAGTLSGQPARDRGRASPCCGACAIPQVYDGARAPGGAARRRSRTVRSRAARRRDADALHDGQARAQLRGRAALRHAIATARCSVTCSTRHLRRAVAVRGDVRLARAQRRGHRQDDSRRVGRDSRPAPPTRARLWRDAACVRPTSASSSRCSRHSREPRFALGLETIYEGYLSHYGDAAPVRAARSRARAPARRLPLRARARAHRLVRRDVDAVADLSELISLCSQLRAEDADGDGALWAASAALARHRLELDERPRRSSPARRPRSPRGGGTRGRRRRGRRRSARRPRGAAVDSARARAAPTARRRDRRRGGQEDRPRHARRRPHLRRR